jgi:transcriptional regulator with GAF, ATPase, and Fis domain
MPSKNFPLLLSVHEAIATIREKKQLFNIIFEKLKEVLPFELAGIQILNKSKTFFEIFMQGYVSSEDEHMVKEFWREKIPASQSLFKFDGEKEFLQVVGKDVIQKAVKIFSPNTGLTNILNKYKISHLINMPLFLDDELLGSILFALEKKPKFTIEDSEILKSLSGPIAIAVNNAMLLEEMAQREREKGILLNFTNILMTIKKREELVLRMAEEIDNEFQFLYVAINAKNGNKNDPITETFIIDESRKLQRLSFQGNREIPFMLLKSKLKMENGVSYAEFTHNEFLNLCEISSHIKMLYDDYGFSSLLYISYGPVAEEINLLLALKNSSGFLEREIESILSIIPQIALIFKNFFAYEEIDFLRKRLEEEKHYLIDEINLSADFQEMIGNSLEMQDVKNKIKQVASLEVTVLIEGETGTGKELVAHAIHNLSQRNGGPFIKVNCAALPAQLIESELFGHEKGSFTGAIEKRIGKFELANGGTIFLDEIGELPVEVQAKFLRVLQEHEFERVGGQSTLRTNIRVVAATNRNLKEEVEKGNFRKDLYFRLNVFPITSPPLSRRKEDIPLFLKFFVEKYSKKLGKPIMSIRKNDLDALMQYNWPGNVRELENVIERAVIISNGLNLDLSWILLSNSESAINEPVKLKTLREVEQEHIIAALRAAGGQVTGQKGAAKILGLNGKTLGTKMRKLGIKRNVVISSQ